VIYCRISHIKDEDQTGVDRQERICRDVAKRLGLTVHDRFVFVDNNRSAWQRDRKRPGWDRLLEAARSGQVQHILCYHPDRLMRQPHDLEELLTIADDNDLTMHGQANLRDLADPDDRFFLRIEVAHACRSSDDTSRRVLDAEVDRAAAGLPHTGTRSYGYTPDAMEIIEEEAEVVREVYRRYLKGVAMNKIADDLNARGVPTTKGKAWTIATIRSLLDSHQIAGIRVFRGQELGPGVWPAIVTEAQFRAAQKRRGTRETIPAARRRRFYTLRGVLTCKRCAVSMGGSFANAPGYKCSRHQRKDELRCTNQIGADKLEKFVADAAVRLLEKMSATGYVPSTSIVPADTEKIEKYRKEIAEAKAAWDAEDNMTLFEYREIKANREKKIRALQPKTIVRPAADVLKGLTGPNAQAAWDKLEETGDHERINAVFQFLFQAVLIGRSATKRGVFDFSRIEIKENPL
jgi:DNA invertase Pin-like site-specific DNA recombinase